MSAALRRLRNPAYTGENRCLPCTIVNVTIALALAVAVVPFSPPLAAAVLLASLAAIALRGYLVPGTPTLTKRYFPDWLLARFDKHPALAGSADEPTIIGGESVDPEELLTDLGAVEPCDDVDDLCLTDSFASDWRERMRSYSDSPADPARVAALHDVSADEIEVATDGDHPEVRVDPRISPLPSARTRRWPSTTSLLADTAADAELHRRSDVWGTVPVGRRLALLEALRAFLETCPLCDEAVEVAADESESCCRSWDVVAVECPACDERLLELDPATAGVSPA